MCVLIYLSGTNFTTGLSPGFRLKVKTFASKVWNILVEPMCSDFMDFSSCHIVSPLAQTMVQILRLVGNVLKFCRQRLKYGRHNSFSTLKWVKGSINNNNTGLLYSAFSIISSKCFTQYYPSKDI